MRRSFGGLRTESTKVVLRDPDTGEVVAVGRAPHELIERDDGTREQDPKWWIDARTAVRDAVRDQRFDIGGIGVSGQQHGLVCLDDRDRPVRPAKLWNDTTTARECDELTRKLGGDSRGAGADRKPAASGLHRAESRVARGTRARGVRADRPDVPPARLPESLALRRIRHRGRRRVGHRVLRCPCSSLQRSGARRDRRPT